MHVVGRQVWATADTGEEPICNRGCSTCLSLLIPACCCRHELNSMTSLTLWIFMALHWRTLPVLFQFPQPQPHCCSSSEWLLQAIRNTSDEPQSNPESLSCLADWYLFYASISVLLPLCFKCIMKNKSWVKSCHQVCFSTVSYSWCAGTSTAGNHCPVEYSSIKPMLRHTRLWPVATNLSGHDMEKKIRQHHILHGAVGSLAFLGAGSVPLDQKAIGIAAVAEDPRTAIKTLCRNAKLAAISQAVISPSFL